MEIIVMAGKDQEGFELQVTDDLIKLKHSNNIIKDCWLLDNCKSLELFSNGNGVDIKLGKRKISLDYSEVQYIYTLIHLMNTYHQGCSPQKIVAVTELQEAVK